MERYGIGSSRRKAIIGINGALCFFVVISLCSICSISFAGTAEVLPKGVWNVRVDYRHSFNVDERYDPDGDTEDVATDYNTSLNSNIFPALGLVEDFFGMPPGSGTVGDSEVSFEYQFDIAETYISYGLTDKLSVGLYIPYLWIENSVDRRLNTTNATIGKNVALNTLTPFAVPGTVPLSGLGWSEPLVVRPSGAAPCRRDARAPEAKHGLARDRHPRPRGSQATCVLPAVCGRSGPR